MDISCHLSVLVILGITSVHLLDAVCKNNILKINDTHPSSGNDWGDREGLNSTIDAFCPPAENGKLEIKCVDNKGEPMEQSTKFNDEFNATCDLSSGLICRRVNRTGADCPDFAVTYTCKCPPTTSPALTINTKASDKTLATHDVGGRSSSPHADVSSTGMGRGMSGTITELSTRSPCQDKTKTMNCRLKQEDRGMPTAVIAGIASGGALLLIIVAGILVYFICLKNKLKKKVDASVESVNALRSI